MAILVCSSVEGIYSFSDGCIDGTDNTANLVKQFIDTYKDKFSKIVQEENLSAEKIEKLIEGEKPSLLQHKTLGNWILKRIVDYVETFTNGMTG